MKGRVFFGRCPPDIRALAEAFAWSGILEGIRSADAVLVKPNLTFPKYREGVTTTPRFIEAVLTVLAESGKKVYVGESDGGYGSFRIGEAFRNFGLPEMCRRLGAELVNLSDIERVEVPFHSGSKVARIALPRFLCEGNVHTLTLPVPKVHCMTGISLSLKNQWGCLPDPMRLRHHVHFDNVIYAINSALKVRYTVVDGTFGLDRNGPIIEGNPVPLGWYLVSANPLAADAVAAHLIGQDLSRIPHYALAFAAGAVPALADIETNAPKEAIDAARVPFRLRRNLWNYLAKTAWYSSVWNRLVYESPASKALHDLMYLFRERPKELAGPSGDPPGEGERRGKRG